MSLTKLAESILENAKCLDQYIASQGLPEASFASDSLGGLPNHLDRARRNIINASNTMKQLSQGPVPSVFEILQNWADLASLNGVEKFRLAEAVPIDGSASYAQIARTRKISESLCRRLIRRAMVNRIFCESPTGDVRHTAISRLLVSSTGLTAVINLINTEFIPAGNMLIEALLKFGESEEPNETAYALAHDTNLPFFAHLSQHPERMHTFGLGMQYWTTGHKWDLKHLVQAFDWASIDQPGNTIVDVGGGVGSVSQLLASKTQHLKFVVQDLPDVVAHARTLDLPVGLEHRLEFQIHDFFKPQTVRPPTAFLLRWVLHDWSDKYCLEILRSLIPSMAPQTRVFIYEFVLRDEPLSDITERFLLDMDLLMTATCNSSERMESAWRTLIQAADSGFVVKSISHSYESFFSLIELAWQPSGTETQVDQHQLTDDAAIEG